MTWLALSLAWGAPTVTVASPDAAGPTPATGDVAARFAEALTASTAGVASCTSALTASYDVRLSHPLSTLANHAIVRTRVAAPPPQTDPSGGLIMDLTCTSAVAIAACRVWGLGDVGVRHDSDAGSVLVEYGCEHLQATGPNGVEVDAAGADHFELAILRSAVDHVLVEAPGLDSVGQRNGTAHLVSVVGNPTPAPPAGSTREPFPHPVAYAFETDDFKPKSRVYPVYPKAARKLGLGQQRCLAYVFMDNQGVPFAVNVAMCDDPFVGPTRASLLQWRWPPPTIDGQPVMARRTIAVTFMMR